nr:MAG TPA: NinG protein [Caudoviricetes sp.]
MTRCKYCHTGHILDAKGRCRSCHDAYMATRNGLHYGDYMAAKPRPYVLPVAVTPLRELPVMKPEKICRICGALIPPESSRRTLCSPECQAEYNRRAANAAHAKAKALRAEQPRPPRCCVVCGKPITRPNAKTCPDCKDEYARAYSREYKRTHQKQKGNAK